MPIDYIVLESSYRTALKTALSDPSRAKIEAAPNSDPKTAALAELKLLEDRLDILGTDLKNAVKTALDTAKVSIPIDTEGKLASAFGTTLFTPQDGGKTLAGDMEKSVPAKYGTAEQDGGAIT